MFVKKVLLKLSIIPILVFIQLMETVYWMFLSERECVLQVYEHLFRSALLCHGRPDFPYLVRVHFSKFFLYFQPNMEPDVMKGNRKLYAYVIGMPDCLYTERYALYIDDYTNIL